MKSLNTEPYRDPQSPLFIQYKDEQGKLLPLSRRARDAQTGVLVADLQEGRSSGLVVYRDKNGVVQQTTYDRFKSWLPIAQIGKMIQRASKGLGQHPQSITRQIEMKQNPSKRGRKVTYRPSSFTKMVEVGVKQGLFLPDYDAELGYVPDNAEAWGEPYEDRASIQARMRQIALRRKNSKLPVKENPKMARNGSNKANAAKAMKLHHSQGIPLSEAWAMVRGGTAVANPRFKSRRNPNDYWYDEPDPILGESVPSRGWQYDLVQGQFGPGLTAPPTNRRNPRPKARASSPGQVAWRAKFKQITQRAREIQHARGCQFKAAFDQARGEVEGLRAAANPGADDWRDWATAGSFDDLEMGPFGPSRVPVARRNVRRRKK